MFEWIQRLAAASASQVVKQVNRLEDRFQARSDDELKHDLAALKTRHLNGEGLDALMPEVFALVRETSRRVLGMRHFDVQIRGGVELARGNVIEMKTGEGKTLVATAPAVLHALSGKGVHVVTVNDYLAKRDAEWMGRVYNALGLTVGCIQEDMGQSPDEETRLRKAAYAADITYGTNSEIVFDHLRDNLTHSTDEIVQRGQNFAIVDEVDLLLIDEAQTPLIISGKGEEDSGLFTRVDVIIRRLKSKDDFVAERRTKSAALTELGLTKVETDLNVGPLSEPGNLAWMHAVHQSLQAHAVYERDVDYIVENGEVYIVDEHTGRVSPDKRFSDGLHQALEAKERVTIKTEDITLAKTSYQHFFRGYAVLSGMTGTAYSEKDEFRKIYFKKVVRVPTHRPMVRTDYERFLFKSLAAKHRAVLDEVAEMQQKGRPVLVGTVSVRESEQLSRLFKKNGIDHKILNAKQHAQEAQVIAQAGRKGAVTISTNMAGRGTDILLGGNAEMLAAEKTEPGTAGYDDLLVRCKAQCEDEKQAVIKAGGLHVVGTGEHESVRIDNQLRGRAGRQGDPGSSIFFVSIEDPVYRMFGEKHVLEQLSEHLADHPEDEPIEDGHINRILSGLREKVEVEFQAVRLDVFKYDMVIHDNRQQIWAWRRLLLESADAESWNEHAHELIADLVEQLEAEVKRTPESETNGKLLNSEIWHGVLRKLYDTPPEGLAIDEHTHREAVVDWLADSYDSRFNTEIDDIIRQWDKQVLLMTIDRLWPQFLTDIERVEQGVGLRGYSQLDPLVEFRREAGLLFGQFLMDVRLDAARAWLNTRLVVKPMLEAAQPSQAAEALRPRGARERKPARPRAIDKLPKLHRGRSRRKKRG